MKVSKRDRILHWVRHSVVLDWLNVGWHIAEVDIGYHAQWAVLLEWLCDCPMAKPK